MSFKNYFKSLSYFSLLIFFIITLLILFCSYKIFHSQIFNLSQKIVFSEYKGYLNTESNILQNFIQLNEVLFLKKYKNKIKSSTNNVYNLIYKTFLSNINNADKEFVKKKILQNLEKSFLKNNTSFIVIFDFNGAILFKSQNKKNKKFNLVKKNIIKFAYIKRKGFYKFILSDSTNQNHIQIISYLKLFEPYNWIILTYFENNEFNKLLKKHLISKLENFVTMNNVGFVITENNKILIKKNIPKLNLSKKKNIPIPGKVGYINKVIFLPELQWNIITSISNESALFKIKKITDKISKLFKFIILFVVLGIIILLSFQFLIFKKIIKAIFVEFAKFIKILKKEPEDVGKDSFDNLQFDEIKDLSIYIYNMKRKLKDLSKKSETDRQYLENITENSGLGFLIIDRDKKAKYCNTEFKKMMNVSDSNFKEKFYKIYRFKDCPYQCNANNKKCLIEQVFLSGKGISSEEHKILTHDGREFPVLFIANPIVENEEINKIVIIIRDISEVTSIKQELFKLKRAIEQAPTSIVITDINATIEYVNPFFCNITGYSYEEAIGNNPRILRTKYNFKYYKDLWNTILSGKVWEGEFLNKKKSGDLYWEKAIIGPVFNDKNEIINFVAVKQDITEIKKLQEKLVKEKEKALIANKFKSEFLASMSHEIRTPMNAILGFIDILYDTNLTKNQKNYLEIIKTSSENLLRILNDILDLSKLESGKMIFEEKTLNLDELISNCINIFSKRAGEKGLSLKYRIGENIPKKLKGDPVRISQVINNLLSNAIKFTKKGEVGVTVTLNKIEKNKAECLFLVYDTGIGIPKQQIDKIFESFAQADASITRKYGGTGLGLAIISKIVNAYNGKIWVESKTGKGSKFYFTLKLPISDEKIKLNEKEPEIIIEKELSFENAKVLVAEDNITNQILIKEIFKKLNINIELAKNGIETLEKLSEKNFDLVFLDWHMPEMDGIETIKILRKLEKNEPVKENRISEPLLSQLKNRQFKIIALTAAVTSDDSEIINNAGFDDFLSKPIDIEKLKRVLKKFLNFSKHTTKKDRTQNTEKEKENLEGLKELIGDDGEMFNTLIESFKKSFHESIKQIKEGLEDKDLKKIKFAAHSIKGSAYNIRFNKIGKIAEDIERNTETKNFGIMEELIKKLENFDF